MYAIIRTGGKQTKVRPGDVIDVELLKTDAENVTFVPLLVVDDSGSAISDRKVLADATVSAKVLGEIKGEKIDIFKYKNKTGYRRRQGHRQRYTSLEVTDIALPKGAAKKAAPAKKAAAAAAEEE
jgi:large subunit ribosomal protein L21